MDDYSKFLIKEYKYWLLQVSEKQAYLGRCVIWCKRSNAEELADATDEEVEEFLSIVKELQKAEKEAFNAEWFNYTFLGNGTRHLHCHFIPRYSSSREFAGQIFEDHLWGHNPYRGEKESPTDPEIIEKVRIRLKELLD
ncbi:HIT family protein [Candidatus Nomurabacteria bacterium]|nr:HIT family protein [Candidatus Nomurabacteria bacterium]